MGIGRQAEKGVPAMALWDFEASEVVSWRRRWDVCARTCMRTLRCGALLPREGGPLTIVEDVFVCSGHF